MQLYPRILPSFTLALTSKSDSPDLPDYYRSTREEVYGPSCRSQEQHVDLMKTIDYRYRESDDDYGILLPDTFVNNGDEDASSSTVFEEYDPQRHMPSTTSPEKAAQSKTAWRSFVSFWRSLKSTAQRLHCTKSTGTNHNFD